MSPSDAPQCRRRPVRLYRLGFGRWRMVRVPPGACARRRLTVSAVGMGWLLVIAAGWPVATTLFGAEVMRLACMELWTIGFGLVGAVTVLVLWPRSRPRPRKPRRAAFAAAHRTSRLPPRPIPDAPERAFD
ncbi:MAG: hypothetical protein K6U14_00930 [Firmicutes bacterium]|nr:hypothetical protein [Alicyclobacillaceae bacterium]MCL6496182.1 hypothetical protein [Bacillota bacterium]